MSQQENRGRNGQQRRSGPRRNQQTIKQNHQQRDNRRSQYSQSRPNHNDLKDAATPPVAEDVTLQELDASVRADLRVLPKDTAEQVGKHLVMAARLLSEDPVTALAHAQVARKRASRLAVTREAVAIAAYYAQDWQIALVEFRTARRLTGNNQYLPLIVDCERALGRHEKAWQTLSEATQITNLDSETRTELAIVAAGMHADQGEFAQARKALELPLLHSKEVGSTVARLRYLYADLYQRTGRPDQARQWFVSAAEADNEHTTDASERILELDGVVVSEDVFDEHPSSDTPNTSESSQ